MEQRRWVPAAALVGVTLVVAAVAFQIAVRELRDAVVRALGPRASVGALEVSWSGVTLHDLRVRAVPGGWPAEDELRAARVHVVPDPSSLFSAHWRIHRITVDQAYLSMQRGKGGRLRLLPALLERAPPDRPAKAVAVVIGEIELRGAMIDFHDASVRHPAHRVRLHQGDAVLGPVRLPALDQSMRVQIKAAVKGPHRDGRMTIDGFVTPATRDAQLAVRFSGVELVALQPYLLKVHEGGVKRGTLDLRLDANVREQRLRAPGTLTLTGLELANGSGLTGTFAGVPRQAVLGAISREGRIDVKFTLDGRLDDPKFSLNENLAARLGVGLAQSLGVSLAGVAEGVGNVVKGLFGR
jgi:hypothetical protein